MVLKRLFPVFCLLGPGLTGCGSGATPGADDSAHATPNPGTVDSQTQGPVGTGSVVGYIDIREKPHGRYLHIDAGFQRFVPSGTASAAYVSPGTVGPAGPGSNVNASGAAGDECIVFETAGISDALQAGTEYTSVAGHFGGSLSAGRSVSISVDGLPPVEAEQVQLGSWKAYASTITFDQPPAIGSLTIDIPGDEFPAFENILLPPVVPLTLTQPVWPEPVDTSSQFHWTPQPFESETASVQVRFAASGTNPGTLTTTSVACTLVDDGSFRFPEPVQARLGEHFSTRRYLLVRQHAQVLYNARATLVVTRSSEE